MGRGIRGLYTIGLLIIPFVILFTLTTCDPMDIRLLVEQLTDTVPPTVDAGTYEAYFPNGGALAGTASDSSGRAVTTTWSEVTELGVTFGDADTLDTTITYDGWTNGEVVVTATLNLNVSDVTNEADAEVTITIYNTDYVFVTPTGTGDGAAPDTPREGDINTAISFANTNGKSAVAVAEGTYSGNSSAMAFITMVEGVSLYGAYSAADWVRDLSENTTTLEDTSTTGGRVVEFPSGTTGNTIIDGFTMQAGTGAGAEIFYCIEVKSGSSSIIQNNALLGGSTDTGKCYGIAVVSSSPVIRNNTISAGYYDTTGSSYGIHCDGTIGSPSPIIRNNTIDGGSKNMANTYGIYILTQGHPTIENNIIFTSGKTGYGIWENFISPNTDPASVKNNDIFDVAIRYNDNGAAGISLNFISNGNFVDILPNPTNILTTPTGTGNTDINPNLDLGDNMHLTGATTAAVKTGGLDGAANDWGFSTDKDGKARTGDGTMGWSMGAYELD